MSAQKRPSRRYWILLSAVLLLAFAVVLPPLININRYQRRIAATIGHSLGRPVHMSSVTLRLLPLPSFELTGFWVEEESHFGAEPLLRSSSVTAYLRVSSLWRGELEIARIHLDEASLNLVRASDGSWNFGSILVQAAHTPNAPTGQRYVSRTPRFPYIEATNARINFKRGTEKMPLSFLNSDLSVWLENPDEWGVHFRAQPARTDLDLDLSDTGLLRIDGTLRRATALTEMPLKLHAEWSSAPLGQLSRLTIGRDIGWRGDLDVQSDITGPLGLAQIKTAIKINGLHRAEFVPAHPLDLQTVCQAFYRKTSRSLEDIACLSPVGAGELRLSGHIRRLPPNAETVLELTIHRVPAAAAMASLQELREGLGAGVRAVGEITGQFSYTTSDGKPAVLSGEAGSRSLRLISVDTGRPLPLGPVRLLLEKPATTVTNHPARAQATPRLQQALLLEPMRLSLGEPTHISIDGRFTLSSFDVHLNGAGTIARLRGLTKALGAASSSQPAWSGIAGARLGNTGTAAFDVNLRGPWLLPIADVEHPLPPLPAEGTISLKDAELQTPYLAHPLTIATASGFLHPTAVAWTDASFSYGTLEGQATLEYPTLCVQGTSCAGHFTLATPTLDVGELQATLLGSDQSGKLLETILSHLDRHSVVWPQISGSVEIGDLSLGKLIVHDATGELEVGGSSMQIRSLDCHFLNGTMHLAGALNAAGGQPNYDLRAEASNVSMPLLASLFAEHWGSGSADVSAQWKMSGYDTQNLTSSTEGTLHWDWRRGGLAPATPSANSLSPARFDRWSGDATVQDSAINIQQSVMTHGTETTPLSGTVSFDRRIDLRSDSETQAFTVAGTMERPRVRILGSTAKVKPAAVVSR